MKILVDMNLSPRWLVLLRRAGFESEHWATVGAADATDADIMAHAAAREYIVLTHDLDFGAILAATGGKKPSVVQIRSQNVDPDVIGHRIVTAIRQMTAELRRGALLTVDPGGLRIRALPLEAR